MTRRFSKDSHQGREPVAAPSKLILQSGTHAKTLKVVRGEILNGRAGRDNLRLVTGKGEKNVEETLLKDGKGLLNRRRPTRNDPVIEEEEVAIKIAREARCRGTGSRSDARVECQSEQRRAERVSLLNASLTADQ